MTKTLMVSVGNYPEPPDAEQAAAASAHDGAAEVLAVWRALMGPHPANGIGDREDFWEMAYRLHAAVRSGAGSVYVSVDDAPARLVDTSIPSWNTAGTVFPLETVYSLPLSYPDEYALYGPVTRWSPGNVLASHQETMADGYAILAPFVAHSGRPIDLVGVGEPGEMPEEATLDYKLREYRDRGIKRAAIKSRATKKMPLLTFDLEPSGNPLPSETEHLIGDYALNLFGREQSFVLQGFLEMHYEYRVFVVGGRPVTAAGCLEERTPLDAVAGRPFDPWMRERRPMDSGPVTDESERAVRYIEFASQVSVEFAELGLHDYVLDVATDAATGNPVVIELNGLLNSGLYATDPTLVTKGLI